MSISWWTPSERKFDRSPHSPTEKRVDDFSPSQKDTSKKITSSKEYSAQKIKKMSESELHMEEEKAQLKVSVMQWELQRITKENNKIKKWIDKKIVELRKSDAWLLMIQEMKESNKDYISLLKEISTNEKKITVCKENIKIDKNVPLYEKYLEENTRLRGVLELRKETLEKKYAKKYFQSTTQIKEIKEKEWEIIENELKKVELKHETTSQISVHKKIRKWRIKRERKRTWSRSGTFWSYEKRKLIENYKQEDFRAIVSVQYDIASLHKRLHQVEEFLPVELIQWEALQQMQIIMQWAEWKNFVKKYELEWSNKTEAYNAMLNHITMKILIEKINEDPELQRLMNEDPEEFDVLNEIEDAHESIIGKITWFTKRLMMIKWKSYWRDLVDQYSKIIKARTYSSEVGTYLKKDAERIVLEWTKINNMQPWDIANRLSTMQQILWKRDAIPEEEGDIREQYELLLPKIRKHFIDQSSYPLNKFSLFWMVAWTQELLSAPWADSEKLFSNPNLNLSLQDMWPWWNTFSYYRQNLLREYSAEWLRVKNQWGFHVDTWVLWFFSINAIRTDLEKTPLSFERLIWAEDPQKYIEKQYEATLNKYIQEHRWWIEKTQEIMHRSIETHSASWGMEDMIKISAQKYWYAVSEKQRDRYYQWLFDGNATGKVSSDTLQRINTLVHTSQFEEFTKRLWVPLREFLEDCNAVWPMSLRSPEKTSRIRKRLDLLVSSAEGLTAQSRFDDLSKATWTELFKEKYNRGTDASWDVMISRKNNQA